MTKRYNLKDIKEMILKVNDNKDLMELNRFLIKSIKAQRWIEGQAKKEDLKAGMIVEWNGRQGFHKGTIVKVNRTRAQVKDNITLMVWNVPMHMLTIVE